MISECGVENGGTEMFRLGCVGDKVDKQQFEEFEAVWSTQLRVRKARTGC